MEDDKNTENISPGMEVTSDHEKLETTKKTTEYNLLFDEKLFLSVTTKFFKHLDVKKRSWKFECKKNKFYHNRPNSFKMRQH